MVCVSLVLTSLAALTIPVWIGRRILMLWLVDVVPADHGGEGGGPQQVTKIHELYTAAGGTYVCWLILRAATLVCGW